VSIQCSGTILRLHSFPTRRSSDLSRQPRKLLRLGLALFALGGAELLRLLGHVVKHGGVAGEFLHAGEAIEFGVESRLQATDGERSEEHTSELQSRENLVCRLLLAE